MLCFCIIITCLVTRTVGFSISGHGQSIGGYNYVFSADTVSWQTAWKQCTAAGGWLSSIAEERENDYLYNVITKRPSVFAHWIGLTQWCPGTAHDSFQRCLSGSNWRWPDDLLYEPETFNAWTRQTESGEDSGCVVMSEQGRWRQEPCEEPRRFICKFGCATFLLSNTSLVDGRYDRVDDITCHQRPVYRLRDSGSGGEARWYLFYRQALKAWAIGGQACTNESLLWYSSSRAYTPLGLRKSWTEADGGSVMEDVTCLCVDAQEQTTGAVLTGTVTSAGSSSAMMYSVTSEPPISNDVIKEVALGLGLGILGVAILVAAGCMFCYWKYKKEMGKKRPCSICAHQEYAFMNGYVRKALFNTLRKPIRAHVGPQRKAVLPPEVVRRSCDYANTCTCLQRETLPGETNVANDNVKFISNISGRRNLSSGSANAEICLDVRERSTESHIYDNNVPGGKVHYVNGLNGTRSQNYYKSGNHNANYVHNVNEKVDVLNTTSIPW